MDVPHFFQKLDDGSLIQPTDEARHTVQKILLRSGYEGPPIQQALAELDEAPDDQRVELAPGIEVAKWSVKKVELDLRKSRLMDPLIPVKAAYEFLACHVGGAIYDDVPQLSEIREALHSMDSEAKAFRVDRLSSNKYEPFHGIYFEENDPHGKVQIRLFGWLAFRVHFPHLSVGGPRFVYTHRLDTGKEYVQVIDV